jgi:hypothetical protein
VGLGKSRRKKEVEGDRDLVITSEGRNETASDDSTTDLPRKLPNFSVYEQRMSKALE